MIEGKFKTELIKKLKVLFPGCMVFHLTPPPQGVPDLLILYGNKWAVLEGKQNMKSHKQPNQPHYIRKMNEMSFGRFIGMDNEEVVLDELQQAFRP